MNHLKQIAGELEAFGLDAMLITSAAGQRYAVGMDGEGVVIVTRTGAQFSTDGRYIEVAREQVTDAQVALIGGEHTHMTLARDYLTRMGVKKAGFESGYMTVDAHHRYSEALPCKLVPAQALVGNLRARKDEDELAAMRAAQKITDETFSEILNFIRPGMTEQEVSARLVYELLRRGGARTSFDPIVAAGPSGSRPHAEPGERVIERGMFVTMDFGCVYEGYCSDMTRTVAVGQPTQEMDEVYHIVLRAQQAAIAAARAGVSGREIDRAARDVIAEAGYGEYFSHSLGHSLGLEIHESPNASPRDEGPMPEGAVISAEPGIYLPGRFGVRIEDVLVLRADGCENLTASTKDLIVL